MSQEERRTMNPLSDEQVEEIAERAADKAVAKITAQFYQEVGKGVVSKTFAIIGVVTLAVYFWASAHGLIK